MWNKDELEKKRQIEESANESFERRIQAWWERQERLKKQSKKHKIEPFLIWERKTYFTSF